jgi:hypothetical protein
MNNLENALEARSNGIVAIPVLPGTKTPAVKWKEWQTRMPPIELQREWFRERCNIAIITTGMVVFDCDDPTKAELVIEKCGQTPHTLRTPSGGFHLGYRKRKGVELMNQVKVKGMGIDIRTDGGLELIPDSETPDGHCEWLGPGLLPVSDLPVANIGWTRKRARKTAPLILPSIESDARIRRAKGYVSRIFSISGSGGHNACYRAFCKCRAFGLTRDEALLVMASWNETNAKPPWTETELLHKADSVYSAPHVR